jgi:hypothetical protein
VITATPLLLRVVVAGSGTDPLSGHRVDCWLTKVTRAACRCSHTTLWAPGLFFNGDFYTGKFICMLWLSYIEAPLCDIPSLNQTAHGDTPKPCWEVGLKCILNSRIPSTSLRKWAQSSEMTEANRKNQMVLIKWKRYLHNCMKAVCLAELWPANQAVDAVSDADEDGEEDMADDDDGAL